MKDEAADVNQRIGVRVRGLRAAAGLSMEGLAVRSGVSRSMISVIERGESSPTAVVLEKLAGALGVSLASLFDAPGGAAGEGGPLARRGDQPRWRDPGSGYVRRNVSPQAGPQPFRIVEVEFPAGRRVAFDNGGRDERVFQQVWVLEGSIEVTWGEVCYRLDAGDCLAMELDGPTLFYNPTRHLARYAGVIADGFGPRRGVPS